MAVISLKFFLNKNIIRLLCIITICFNLKSTFGQTSSPGINVSKCEQATPKGKSDCFAFSDQDYSCCYVQYKVVASDTNYLTKCASVNKTYEFVPQFIREVKVEDKFYPALYICASDPQKICSTSTPKEVEDCGLHGSSKNSCCMLTYRDKTKNCILSLVKISPNETIDYTFQDNLISCHGGGAFKIRLGWIIGITLLILFMFL